MNNQPFEILGKYFGYPAFRPGQEEVIRAILGGRDALAVMPTGAGKSLCFQIPALMFGGITLVVSPLISLMRDQVAALTQNGVAAAFINSSLTQAQTDKALARARQGLYKIIYVAPERLDAPSFTDFAQTADVSMVAVDEAHCVSHWGQDFRPSYLNISAFIASLPKRPVVAAFTATATSDVKDDVIRLLGLENPLNLTMGFNRENLYFEVRRPRDKYGELAGYLLENKGKSGIVYCATRKTVNEVTERLNHDGFPACAYHAGLSQAERVTAQDDFVYDRKSVIVATNAFGMGIDKSNVAFVIHYNMPKNMESYYQEAGRAGRDGSPAECVLFFSAQDIIINKYLIEHTGGMGEQSQIWTEFAFGAAGPESEKDDPLTPDELKALKARDYKRLTQIEWYCKTAECLRRYILDYFGDTEAMACDNCGNCRAERKMADVTVEAQKILSCVCRMNRGYGITTVIDVLRGAKSEKLSRLGLDSIKTYGAMADKSAGEIRLIADFLLQGGYLRSMGGEYPVVKVAEKGNSVLFDGEKVFMPVLEEGSAESDLDRILGKRPSLKKKAEAARAAVNTGLLAALKELRLKIAHEENVPAFVIFSDATLVDMCARMPSNEEEMLGVSGVGQVKLAKYGAAFLNVLRGFAGKDAINGDSIVNRMGFYNKPPKPAANDIIDTASFVEDNFMFFDEPVPVSVFMDRINALVYQKRSKGLSSRRITGRLIDEGYLEDKALEGSKARVATEKGLQAGISTVREENAEAAAYYRNYYNPDAQKMILGYVVSSIRAET
ncbi:MAG: ATP-dependent DNA helicase [Firmicutes bacterium]|nr:ATP-dependent DNA helicase [Bacillota bacterium]